MKIEEIHYKEIMNICLQSDHPKWRHGVLVYAPGEFRSGYAIVSATTNNQHAHAETRGILAARLLGYKHGLVLVSGRISKDGKRLCMAKPCLSCYWHAMDRGVIEIYYTNERGTIVKMPKVRD